MSAKAGPKESGFAHLQNQGQGLSPTVAVEFYLRQIMARIQGMKVLLLDWETTGIVSMVATQTQILEEDVFLTSSLQDQRERMSHLVGVVVCRPTKANIQALRRELGEPKYKEYHVFFTNVVSEELLRQLADADVHQRDNGAEGMVVSVQEIFADFYAINNELFTLNISDSIMHSFPRSRWRKAEEGSYFRTIDGVLASLLALKKRPVIRYQKSSDLCMNFAREVKRLMERERTLFDFRESGSSLLLIMDRRDDPITPLLTQWTYQAMVHELLGIRNNRVSLKNAPNVQADMEEVVLSLSDQFFANHMFSNFGDLGEAIKELLESYQKLQHNNRQISSIEDMQRFVDSYPQFKQFATNVSKHVAVVSELARLVAQHKLMDISQLEQELACNSDHSTQAQEVEEKVRSPATSAVDAVRLVLLYAIRYETFKGNKITTMKRLLREKGVSDIDVQLIHDIIDYAGASKRGSDLFGDSTLLSKSIKMATRAVKGVSNVYAQHKPLLHSVLEQLSKGKLKDTVYPFAGAGNAKERPKDVIVFIMGGTTFEEAAIVHEFNQNSNGMQVVLGGSTVHNSRTFLAELARRGRGAGLPMSSFSST